MVVFCWGPWEAAFETMISLWCIHYEMLLGSTPVKGKGGSRIEQEEKWGCGAVPLKGSVNPVLNSATRRSLRVVLSRGG